MTPLTLPIANGLAFGITAHALLELLRGRVTPTDWLLSCWRLCWSRASSGCRRGDHIETAELLALRGDLSPCSFLS
jgi:hypothetical protein